MEAQGVPLAQMIGVAGGERVRLSDDVVVDVYPSQHSCVWSHEQMSESRRGLPRRPRPHLAGAAGALPRARRALRHARPRRAAPPAGQRPGRARRRRRARVPLPTRPTGSLFYQDTSGHWSGILRDLRPDVAILAAAGRGNIDGEPIQGSLAQFVGRQVDLLAPAPRLPRPSRRLAARLLASDRREADPRRDRARAARHRADRDRLRHGLSALQGIAELARVSARVQREGEARHRLAGCAQRGFSRATSR